MRAPRLLADFLCSLCSGGSESNAPGPLWGMLRAELCSGHTALPSFLWNYLLSSLAGGFAEDSHPKSIRGQSEANLANVSLRFTRDKGRKDSNGGLHFCDSVFSTHSLTRLRVNPWRVLGRGTRAARSRARELQSPAAVCRCSSRVLLWDCRWGFLENT